MRSARSRWMVGVALGLGWSVAGAAATASPPHRADDEAREVSFLTQQDTAYALATASLLSHLVDTPGAAGRRADPASLMNKAVSRGPNRPVMLWLWLRDCQLRHCDDEAGRLRRLIAADPDNGLASLSQLGAAQSGPAEEATKLLARIGASKTLNLYWNESLVMMFDAMTHGHGSPPATALTAHADDRLSHAAAVLGAVDIPPFKPILNLCAVDQCANEGRRQACESLMRRLDASDSIIAQSLSVTVQLKWRPVAAERAVALQKLRSQQEYIVQASGRVRDTRVDADAEVRVAAMRRLATEEEVDKVILDSFQEPAERPDDWQSPRPQ